MKQKGHMAYCHLSIIVCNQLAKGIRVNKLSNFFLIGDVRMFGNIHSQSSILKESATLLNKVKFEENSFGFLTTFIIILLTESADAQVFDNYGRCAQSSVLTLLILNERW